MEHTLYRKYRPQHFTDVRSQDHVVQVLQASIAQGAVPHALLFVGTRGTGKTTLARIFARELGVADEDLYELDAASNNSVENIRDLNEAVVALPFLSPYKVYILDEVHMLSKSAWNAFLKTLEEPPRHVVFIMATTELEKVPETVLSRCQVFALHEPDRAAIAALILHVFEREGVTLPQEVADTIAIAANGSYRDALSIAQNVLLMAKDGAVTAEDAASIIGAPTSALVQDMLAALGQGDAKTALAALTRVPAQTASIDMCATLLIERVRAVMLLRATKNDDYVLSYGEEAPALRALVGNARVNSQMLQRLLEARQGIGAASIPSIALECAFVELCA
ncbi:DNA polymerase III, subunit gamma and tau [Candidatus Kaiserbacteria bacterium RIFCSPHIGHO2_02_FULL_50_50]|uniref:DNA polymerase III subunit gamma/tau n=1 Tax=Candidatus Kaiserbacteria bacterium RIFCSPHIGHO2_02_FULL_50_50 TaxID=1798492 RepID=A0A1F6DEV5_9BACT|nr:MAG: DNA polymerase III, subunit gamma and tau [Candidatus Kaiserbacteria bacterium RIFCSPHIGHO2_02_FULL_50_50]OGG89227.1 MAG: DNA polymerase III, subunit gamma and tau [Candidatus Kaiserbacteria bacterium RIFCSPLOWO2_12_FULL_50_10]